MRNIRPRNPENRRTPTGLGTSGHRLLALVLTLTILLAAAPAGASTDLTIEVDDYAVMLDPLPFITNGRTMVDLMVLADAVGATAEVAADARSGSITFRNTTVSVSTGDAAVEVVGLGESMVDMAPQTTDGRLIVPLRHVLEGLGFDVGWENASRTVLVRTPMAPVQPPVQADAQVVELSTANFAFAPNEITVAQGRPVQFVVMPNSSAHTFTIDDLDVDLVVPSGETGRVTVTFSEAGTYTFVCRFHRSVMTGTITVVEPPTATGTVRITDGAARSDRATVAVEGAMPGTYEVRFLDRTGDSIATAALDVSASGEGSASSGADAIAPGTGSVVWNSPDQINIFTRLNEVEVRRGTDVVLKATLPGSSYNHIKHVLSGDPDGGPGYAVSMLKQAQGALQHATLAARGDSVAWVQNHADHVHSYLTGELTGLRPGNANPATLDDAKGFGLRRYVTEAARHAGFAAAQDGATDAIKLHNTHVQNAAENLIGTDGQSGWIGEAATLAREIAAMDYGDDVATATADAQRLRSLIDQVLNGVDSNGNGRVDPIVTEAAAMTAYQHAQFMGWWYLR